MTEDQSRRAALAAALAMVGAARVASAQPATAPAATQHEHDMSRFHLAPPRGPEDVAFLLYPGCTALDFVGPHNMFRGLMGATVRLVAKTRDPIVTDTGLTVIPDTDFASCPERLTVMCVPGGSEGTLQAMEDPETMAFLADRGGKAEWVTAVCTGSLLLGAAGLLRGYQATSHWITRDLLPIFGAIPMEQRVVMDRNRATGGGVTAGIDFGLAMVARLRDDAYAKAVQLVAEYDPEPPFDAGSPAKAPAETREMITAMFAEFVGRIRGASVAATEGRPR
jgi:putative intracellular protease/amidase